MTSRPNEPKNYPSFSSIPPEFLSPKSQKGPDFPVSKSFSTWTGPDNTAQAQQMCSIVWKGVAGAVLKKCCGTLLPAVLDGKLKDKIDH